MRKFSKPILFITLILSTFCSTVWAQSADCIEDQRCADQGNGYYQNPILGGDYPDPSVLRVGDDYYMTHSSFIYYPGLLIWHSKDLVNWEPVGHALTTYVGSVYAPDFVRYKNKYYIYFPANGTNWVVTADSPEGPWSDPVDLEVGNIDPGHVVDREGNRYLHLSDGHLVRLSDDGLSAIGEVRSGIYGGWPIPDSMNVECFCLESPKLSYHDGYYYLTVAEGGTAGPSTSHMVVSARSKSIDGLWENSPYNPIVHTHEKDETWWSKGHGTLVDDTEGNYWIMYHGYQNNYRTLGRQTLMEPIEWTDDGWFRVPEGVATDDMIPKPAGEKITHGMRLSDDFDDDKLDLQWQFFKNYELDRIQLKDGSLFVEARGGNISESSPLVSIPVNKSYQLQVEFEITEAGATGGLTLFYNEQANVGIGVDSDMIYVFRHGRALTMGSNTMGDHGYLRLVNIENEIMMYYSTNGQEWKKADKSLEVSGYQHNAFHGFLSLRTGLFTFGDGQFRFDNFSYKGLKNE